MKVHYSRVSTYNQNSARQQPDEKKYFSVEDTCSGSIAFFERDGGKKILEFVENKTITSLHIHSIDRLGRDLKDILNTVSFFNELKIPITFLGNGGLTTLNEDGEVNFITAMVISFLGTVAEMEKIQIKERQLEGIRIAKLNERYTGRKKGTEEDVLKFLSKPKNKKALDYMRSDKNLTFREIAELTKLNVNTLTKIKKRGLQNGK